MWQCCLARLQVGCSGGRDLLVAMAVAEFTLGKFGRHALALVQHRLGLRLHVPWAYVCRSRPVSNASPWQRLASGHLVASKVDVASRCPFSCGFPHRHIP
jgi:hypothetical protein